MVSVGEKRWEGGELCRLVAMELTLLAEIPELLPLLLLPANLANREKERLRGRQLVSLLTLALLIFLFSVFF